MAILLILGYNRGGCIYSRLDHNTVAHRQSFLERYMQQLINCVAIRTCSELRLFLDYEVNFNESTSQSPRVP